MDLHNTKLICLDMDGTLFSTGGVIPDINIRALKKCVERGIRVAIISGRNQLFEAQYGALIAPSVILASANGARIDECAGGRCIFEGFFTPEEMLKKLRIFESLDLYFEVYTCRSNYQCREELMPPGRKLTIANYIKYGQVHEIGHIPYGSTEPMEKVYKFVAFAEDETPIRPARAKLDKLGIKHCSSSARNIEVMPDGVGKDAALKIIADYYHIDMKDTMAFGDYTNDTEMLRTAGCGVAMQNGVPEAKAAAKLIAPLNTEGGVGQILEKYVLS